MSDLVEFINEIPPPFSNDVAEVLKHSIEKTLRDAFEVQTEMDAWSVRKGPLELHSFIVCTIDMRQDNNLCSTFITALDRQTVSKILKKYGIDEAHQSQEIMDDTVTEVANMIYGMFKTALNKNGYYFAMDLPVSQNPNSASFKFDHAEKMVLPFLADGNQCRIVISHN